MLMQMNIEDALLGFDKMDSSWTKELKQLKDRKALTKIPLHLSNHILQDVLKERIVVVLLLKLE